MSAEEVKIKYLQKKESTPRKGLFFVLFIVLISASIGWLTTRSAIFSLSELQFIKPLEESFKQKVILQMMPSLGKNIMTMSLIQLAKEIKKNPEVKSVFLRRKLPNTLQIEIILKREVAYFKIKNENWILDESCSPLKIGERKGHLPSIEGDRFPPQELCEFLSNISHRNEKKILEYKKFQKINWYVDRGLVMYSSSLDLELQLGYERFALAWVHANLAAEELVRRKLDLRSIDASYKSRVVATLKNSTNKLDLNKLERREAPPTTQGGAL